MSVLNVLDGIIMFGFLSLPSEGSSPTIYQDRVDLIELNHLYDDCGEHVYDQVILWDWSPDYRRYHVVTWLLIGTDKTQLPERTPSGEHRVRWSTDYNNARYVIHSNMFRETYANRDPESTNRAVFNEKLRRRLNGPPEDKPIDDKSK